MSDDSQRCPWCGERFEHNCDRPVPEDQPGEIYLLVVTSGEYSNKRLYVLEWFAVREVAMERAIDLANLDAYWTKVWLDDSSRTFNEQYDFEVATLSAARTAMRDPHWRVPINSTEPTSYRVHALRCGADTFEHLERTENKSKH